MASKPEIKDQLLKMVQRDLDHRQRLVDKGTLSDAYDSDMENIHIENGLALKEIIDSIGWPTQELVDEEGEKAAWIIAHHSISLPQLQRQVLKILKDLNPPEVKSKQRIAMLEDRILFFEGKPQKYGTNFDWDENGDLKPTFMEDRQTVDQRRAAIGFESLDQAQQRFQKSEQQSGIKAPKDKKLKDQKFLQWLEETGWR